MMSRSLARLKGTTALFVSLFLQKFKFYVQFLRVFAKFQKGYVRSLIFVLNVRPSVLTEQLCPHWIDFYEIWYLRIILKFGEKILKPGKNNAFFTRRPKYIYDNISLNSSQNRKCFRQIQRKSKHTFYIQYPPPHLPRENRAIYVKMQKKQNEFSRFHCSSANVSVPTCRVIRTLPIILSIITAVRLEKLMQHGLRAAIAASQVPTITVFSTRCNIKKCCIFLMLCLV